jgi:HEAT repeat protein
LSTRTDSEATRDANQEKGEAAFKIAFVTSIITFVLTFTVLLFAVAHLNSMPRGGMAGFAVIGYARIYFSLILFLGLTSFGTGIFAAIGLRPARWYLAGVLVFTAVCVRIAKPWDAPDPEDVNRLVQGLGKDRGDDWERNVTWLANLGEKSAPALAQGLQHKNSKVRLGAAKALEGMAFRNKAATPQLVAALEDEDDQVRIAAASACAWFWKKRDIAEAKIALSGLIKSLHDNNWEVRFKSSYALMQIANGIGDEAAAAIPALVQCLENNENESIHEYAACALGYIGPAAKAALPALEALPETGHLGLSVLLAIWRISEQPEPTVTKAMRFLQHPSEHVSEHAADVLGEIGPPAANALPALRALSARTGKQAYADAIKKIAPKD